MRSSLLFAAALWVVPLGANADAHIYARSLAATCANCHGTDGHSVGGNEPLAGMPKADIVRKLNEFRSGAKPATIMHQLSKGYSDEQIEAIAGYFASLPAKK